MFVRNNNSNQEISCTVTVNKHLGDELGLGIDHLELLSSDVLALRQFEEILLAIDNLDSIIGQQHGDIAGVVPPLAVDGGLGLFRLLVVATEENGSTNEQFTTSNARNVIVMTVHRQIAHIRHIDQFDLTSRSRTTNITRSLIFRFLKNRTTSDFSSTIAFHHHRTRQAS